ncbi:mercury resistance system transport protein MerF [Aestuariirhabdus sp. LZHN29]|uniref:mercury resistance system transport protein MerF n=1 Tax=Aestuariirhabdus sp. LZHN29 TaxID=3417462 RepID=UPI003CE68000
MNKLTKIGLTGSLVAALCCFTPILVWLFAALGLSAMVGYLDLVLFPLLGVFTLLLLIGLVKSASKDKA